MKRFVLIIMISSLFIAGVLSYYASKSPDGLERVAQDQGFVKRIGEPSFSLIPDYRFPGMRGFLSNWFAGIVGVTVTYGLAALAGKIMSRRKKSRGNNHASYTD